MGESGDAGMTEAPFLNPKAIGIAAAAVGIVFLFSLVTCSMTGTYLAGDLAEEEPRISMQNIEEEYVPALSSLKSTAPVTDAHRDALVKAAQSLIQEKKDTLAQINAGVSQKKTMKELEPLRKKYQTQQLLLLTTAEIVKDGALTREEYTAWVQLYQVRGKDDLKTLKNFQDSFGLYKKQGEKAKGR
ncbi:MAG: hypothetical protein J0L97_01120 [Alphaproteobacteria bacterium]|nr:hypothetical protein [Alphaproteobacteria bacterium]